MDQEPLQQFVASVSRCQERTFFKIRDNRVGCGPSNTRPGNLIRGVYFAASLFGLRLNCRGTLSQLTNDAYVQSSEC